MMRKNRTIESQTSFSWYIVFFLFIIIPYFLPYYVKQEIVPDTIFTLMNYLSIVLMFYFTVKHKPCLKLVSTQLLLIIIIYILLIYTTYVNDGEVELAVQRMIRIVLICATITIVVSKRKYFGIWFLYAVKYYTLVFCLIDIVTMMVYPTGIPSYTQGKLAPHFIFGNVNTTIKMLFPGMLCSSLIDLNKKRISLGTIVFWFCIIYQFIFIYRTATSFIALMFVTLWMLFNEFISDRLKRLYFVGLITVLIFEISIVLISNTSIIMFVTGLFNKSADFSGRFVLWQRVMQYIIINPVFGIGLHGSEFLRFYIGNASGSHNYFLDLVYQQGIIGLALFLYFVITPLVKIKRNLHVSQALYVVLGYCIAYLIMFISEPFYGHELTFFPVFFSSVVLCYVDKLNTINEHDKKVHDKKVHDKKVHKK